MTTPFDSIARHYADLWSDTEQGIGQRAQVWNEIDRLFQPEQTILDLGCGAGDDALHLGERGIRITAIDASQQMVELARSRGVDAGQLAIEQIGTLHGPFDGALSNFGALNCVSDLRQFASKLSRLVRPSGLLAICVLSRFSWRETLRYALRCDFKKATRRWSGRTQWRGLDVYYRNAREMESALGPHFHLTRRVAIGGGDHQLYIFQRRAE